MDSITFTTDLIQDIIQRVGCNTARISIVNDTMFVIIGYKRSTKDDLHSYWVGLDGAIMHFDYVVERTIASGENITQVLNSYYEYLRAENLTAF